MILLKNIIFLKNIPNIILNSKKYHGQLDVIRSSIKNNLFETSKELLEFKFKQKLRKEFTNIDEVFKNKIFALTHGLKKTEFSNINVNKLLNIQHKQLSSRVERWAYEGSGGTINSIIQK